MSFDGALIKEQGVTFAIAVVKPSVLTSPNKESIRQTFSHYFGFVPTVLMAQNSKGIPTYDGRRNFSLIFIHLEFPGNIIHSHRKDNYYGKSTYSSK